MGKALTDQVLDASLDEFATATRVVVCSDEPANFAGIAAVALADVAVTPGAGNGDFTKANGDVSGRKVTVAQQAAVPIDTTGTATHVSYDDGSVLLGVTTCTSQALTSGGTVTIPAHDLELADPA
jgi:hypothetical protein